MLENEIAKILLEKKAVKINPTEPFTWTSGIRSPIYCDNRALVSFVDARDTIIDGFVKKIEEAGLDFEAVAGVATGAIAWGALVADRLKKPLAYIRPEPRSHGTSKQVEGDLKKGVKLLIIEDLFSTAGSTVKCIEAARKEVEADIVGVVAISTYEFEKAKTRLEEANVKWFTLTNFTAIVNVLEISEDEKKAVLEFAQNPAEWWDNQSAKA